eukprot:m.22842 g.22842  ORF g.22842 m.22842 type:complete len:138 (+) comp8902_c0_seq1:102-515(+)
MKYSNQKRLCWKKVSTEETTEYECFVCSCILSKLIIDTIAFKSIHLRCVSVFSNKNQAKQSMVTAWCTAFDAASDNVNFIINNEVEQFKEKLQQAQLLLRQLSEAPCDFSITYITYIILYNTHTFTHSLEKINISST